MQGDAPSQEGNSLREERWGRRTAGRPGRTSKTETGLGLTVAEREIPKICDPALPSIAGLSL